LLFSGVGTLIFFVIVGGRVPSYLGSSFSFIAVVIAASGYSGQGPNLGLDVATERDCREPSSQASRQQPTSARL